MDEMEHRAVTPKQFAGWLKAVSEMRDGSWDEEGGGKSADGFQRGAYKLRYSECVQAVVPKLWWPIFDCLLTPNGGYGEVWEWAEKQLTE